MLIKRLNRKMSNILENNLVELFAFYIIKFVSAVFFKINKNNNFSNIISSVSSY